AGADLPVDSRPYSPIFYAQLVAELSVQDRAVLVDLRRSWLVRARDHPADRELPVDQGRPCQSSEEPAYGVTGSSSRKAQSLAVLREGLYFRKARTAKQRACVRSNRLFGPKGPISSGFAGGAIFQKGPNRKTKSLRTE